MWYSLYPCLLALACGVWFMPSSICAGICNGTDYSQPAKCYADAFPQAYRNSQSIFRVWILFEEWQLSHCTAWLLGCEGHVLTNKHCVDSQDMADQLRFELMAEGESCEDECQTGLWPCPGPVFIDEPLQVVKLGSTYDFDYTLLQLPPSYRDLWKQYGYLELRNASAIVNEPIYVPQHPLGYGKRIAMYSTPTPRGESFSITINRHHKRRGPSKQHYDDNQIKILSTNAPGFNDCGQYQVTHNADTASGASGSPILAHADHKVVALHHCSGCYKYGHNGAIPSKKLVQDLGEDLPKCAVEHK